MSLADICLVVDFEGFRVRKQFRCREFGFYCMNMKFSFSYRFDLSKLEHQLSEKERKTARFCTRSIHGLSFNPMSNEKYCYQPEELKMLLMKEWEYSKKGEKVIVAYKGGHIERELLEELHIPNLNIEIFGCPKFTFLPTPTNVSNCGFHDSKLIKAHCPRTECETFAYWIKNELDKQE